MPDTIPTIAFSNQLTYDVIVYDSFDDDDDSSTTNGQPDSQAYFATLTQLGKVPAGQTVNIQPIHDSSAFVVESVSDSKPVKRMVALSFDDVTALSITADDQTAMTQTFQFVNFFLNNLNDPIAVAFNKVLNNTTDDLATDIDNFFASQPAYNKCCFEDYMMALAYSALHPSVSNPSQPAGSYSLSIISILMGSKWPAFLSDIFVTKFTCTSKDKRLILTFEMDISTLPFESLDIAANVLSIMNGTKMVKAQILFNYAIGLNIFGTRLSILEDAIAIPVGSNKTYSIQKPQISIDINPLFKFVVFTMEGTFPFSINGKTFDALASFVIDNDEAAIGVDIQGDHSTLPPPPGLKGLYFDEFGVGMGLFFKPPGFGIGIQGKFHIGSTSNTTVSLDDNNFALVCEAVEEAVEPKYVSFYIPKLDLNTLVTLFTNKSISLDVPVNFTDLSFHWSDGLMDAVVLPDGTLSAGGYGFSAALDLFSFGFYGEANLDINTGLTANIEVSPINWKNVFQLTGDGKGYSLKYDKAGNPIKNNFVPTTQAEKDAVANAISKQVVAPGGACLIINTLSMPILHLNAKASLFDLIDYAVTADVNKDGISFTLNYGAILTQQMACKLSDYHNFYGQFGYSINKSIPLPVINGVNLGSIPLKADASLHLAINTSTTDVVISTGGQFDFEGLHFSFGDFTADINITKIADFVGAIVQYLVDNAKAIFNQLLDTAEHWAAAAAKGIVTGCDDVGKVMKSAYNKTAQEMTTILKGAGFAANDIARGLLNGYNAASQDVAAILKQAGYDVTTIGTAIKNTWNCGIDDVSWALRQVGYGAEDVANAVKSAFNATAQDVANTLKKWGYAADDVANVIKNIFRGDSIAVAKIMKAAGYAIDDISRGIKDAWNCATTDVTYALRAAGYTANEVAVSLKNVFNAASQDVAAALKAMGYAVNDIGAAIKNCWNCGINDVAWALNWVGYNADEITSALRSTFNAAAQDVITALKWLGVAYDKIASVLKNDFACDVRTMATYLKNLGYSAAEIASVLKNVYNLVYLDCTLVLKDVGILATDAAAGLLYAWNAASQDIGTGFKMVGYIAGDTANALKNVYQLTINNTAAVMKQAGYAANEVASALQSAFNTSVEAVADAMKQVGYAANDVKNAFDELGGDFESFADTAWNDVKNVFNPSNW